MNGDGVAVFPSYLERIMQKTHVNKQIEQIRIDIKQMLMKGVQGNQSNLRRTFVKMQRESNFAEVKKSHKDMQRDIDKCTKEIDIERNIRYKQSDCMRKQQQNGSKEWNASKIEFAKSISQPISLKCTDVGDISASQSVSITKVNQIPSQINPQKEMRSTERLLKKRIKPKQIHLKLHVNNHDIGRFIRKRQRVDNQSGLKDVNKRINQSQNQECSEMQEYKDEIKEQSLIKQKKAAQQFPIMLRFQEQKQVLPEKMSLRPKGNLTNTKFRAKVRGLKSKQAKEITKCVNFIRYDRQQKYETAQTTELARIKETFFKSGKSITISYPATQTKLVSQSNDRYSNNKSCHSNIGPQPTSNKVIQKNSTQISHDVHPMQTTYNNPVSNKTTNNFPRSSVKRAMPLSPTNRNQALVSSQSASISAYLALEPYLGTHQISAMPKHYVEAKNRNELNKEILDKQKMQEKKRKQFLSTQYSQNDKKPFLCGWQTKQDH